MRYTKTKRQNTKTYRLQSLAATEKLAEEIAGTLKGGEVIGLTGELGAGKTTFVQALARALNIKDLVKSPTFTILQVYSPERSKQPRLCHVDVYRLSNTEELAALGLYDYLSKPDTVTVIEWAEKIKKALPATTLWLTFSLFPKRTVQTKQQP
ncbi:MAG: tRNA (adenosine(37)-N6)-threonylcarbamoyltransferase complex ATPase subunit type 1 TsaE [Patescibacteria group bacterium]|jgi:tRNA threonylcarbamoyladenosine biosynthesis protein TsaE